MNFSALESRIITAVYLAFRWYFESVTVSAIHHIMCEVDRLAARPFSEDALAVQQEQQRIVSQDDLTHFLVEPNQ